MLFFYASVFLFLLFRLGDEAFGEMQRISEFHQWSRQVCLLYPLKKTSGAVADPPDGWPLPCTFWSEARMSTARIPYNLAPKIPDMETKTAYHTQV